MQLQLEAVALTDHDTAAGLPQAEVEATRLGLPFIPGIELTANHQGGERHILGYWMSTGRPELVVLLARMAEERRRRIARIVEKLEGCGARLDPEAVLRVPHQGVLGRMHVAVALCQEGLTSSVQEAFDQFLGDNGPAYVPKYALTVEQTIDLIHRAGGVAVLAHPGSEPNEGEVAAFAQAGLDGLEALYPSHAPRLREYYCDLARQLGLVPVGGSDFHGERKPQWLGAVTVPMEVVEELKDALPLGSSASG